MDEISSKKVNYDNTIDHILECFRTDLRKFIQFDNSAKNIVGGITKSTGSKPPLVKQMDTNLLILVLVLVLVLVSAELTKLQD